MVERHGAGGPVGERVAWLRAELGDLPEDKREALCAQYEIFAHHANRMSLSTEVSASDALRNVREAVAAARLFRGRVLDIGSGAGYPIVSIAILRPELCIELCERRRRRAAFLELLVAHLRLGRVTVRGCPVDELEGSTWNTVSARAIARGLLDASLGLVSPGGRLVLFVGENEASRLGQELPKRATSARFERHPGSRTRGLFVADFC